MGGLGYYFLNSSRSNTMFESILIGLSIFFYYNLSRVIRVRDYYAIQSNLHLQWVSKNLTEIIISLSFAAIFVILLGFKTTINYQDIAWLILISALYIFLRERPFLKNLLIAKAWCLAFGIFGAESNFIFAYFLGLSLWYDFKDDKEIDYSKVVLVLMALGVAGLIFYHHFHFEILELSLFFLSHLLILMASLKFKSEFFYLFIVDCMILMSGFAIFAFRLEP